MNKLRGADIKSVLIKLASPEKILSWSYGEVLKPETINYKTGRPERSGLFSEVIFGPVRDYECYCGKYKKNQFTRVICDRCNVEVTHSSVRRERLGHIVLATPITHIWFLKVYPYSLSLFLDIPIQRLEKVIYYSAYVITRTNEEQKKKILEKIEKEYKERVKKSSSDKEKTEIDSAYKRIKEELKSITVKNILSDVEFFALSRKYPNLFEVGTGSDPIRRFLEELDLSKLKQETEARLGKSTGADRKKLSLKLKIIKAFMQYQIRPEWMILTILPIIPPDLRPIVQLGGTRFASSDLNDLYRRVINRNNRLKKLYELKAPEIIVRNEKRMLQEAIDALLDNTLKKDKLVIGQRKVLKSLADMLKGKTGRFRQNLLGKRVDYSGRSVIVIGPELEVNECGLPKKIALELFKPFIIHELLKTEAVHTIKQANYLIESEDSEALKALELVIRDKFVLLNRAPTLHRLGIRAFRPVLIEGLAIRVPPLVCIGYNADFDGDQMAVFLPLSQEAQTEAKDVLNSAKNILKPGTGEAIVAPVRDIIFGVFYLTQFLANQLDQTKKVHDSQTAKILWEQNKLELRSKIRVKYCKSEHDLETSVGRIIFNEALPSDYPYVNEVMNKKKTAALIEDIYQKYGHEKTSSVLNKITKIGFHFATASGISWGFQDLITPAEKEKLVRQTKQKQEDIEKTYEAGLLSQTEKRLLVIEEWLKTIKELHQTMIKSLPSDSGPRLMVESGARGSWTQLAQMVIMKGLVENPKGEIIELPITRSYKEGLTSLTFFISAHGARKGASDIALKTAKAGYLTRKMIDVAHDVVVSQVDCGDKVGVVISKKEAEEAGEPFVDKIYSRLLLEAVKDKAGKIVVGADEYITRQTAEVIAAAVDQARVRSPFTCKTLFGICSACYGFDLAYNRPVELGQPVGIIAAQSIGEPATQLTMRTFHFGGVAGAADITQGVPRAEELLEARPPKSEGVLSPCNGRVKQIEKTLKNYKILIQGGQGRRATLTIPRSLSLLVKVGEKVLKGQPLNEGYRDPKKIYAYEGKITAFKYILNELKKVYNFQGAEVHDKHIEVIIRKIFSRVRVKDPGDSDFVPDEIIEKDIFLNLNRSLKAQNRKIAQGRLIVLGITRVALSTHSFLSAASFQETSRVLVRAALECKEDPLRGLKENVIVGRKPPIGAVLRERLYKKVEA